MSQIFSTSPSVLKLLSQPSRAGPEASLRMRLHLLLLGLRAQTGASPGRRGGPEDTVQAPCNQDGKDRRPVVSVHVPGEQKWNSWVLGAASP